MEENRNIRPNNDISPPRPRRRRRRTKMQLFKEAYLPYIIMLVALILIVSFIVGSMNRGKKPDDIPQDTTPPETTQSLTALLEQEAKDLLAQAEKLAAQYDYEKAMKLLATYSGGINTRQELMDKYQEYNDALASLVPYNQINEIPNLSFRLLMADLSRALSDKDYGNSFNKNYVTTGEFEKILQQLYDNGYMLVSIYDIAPKTVDANGNTTISQGTIYLPEGKKPLVMTQVAVNYFTYIVDGDGDGLPDKDGSGFPNRLILDANGELTSEMVDARGNVVTGNFDFVTILNAFIEKHPDFSYRGAKATLAVTGYDGLFGYRTDPETATKIGQEFYEEQLEQVVPVIEKLREDGYDIACYSYDFANYASLSTTEINNDLKKWKELVQPLLGDVDIMVFPYDDVGDTNLYTGNKYKILKEFGFTYYVRKDSSTSSWGQLTDAYARMSRREVTGSLMYKSPAWFEDLFNSATVLDPNRGFGN